MTRGRRPGLGRTAAALTALAFFAAGCDNAPPEPKGVLAVERAEDGGVRLLLADCPGYAARDFSVLEDTEGGDTLSWSVHNGGAGAAVRDVRAFQDPPEGWRVTDDSLAALREGVPYVATVNGFADGRNLRGRVPFTTADLAGLGDGQVLAWAGGDETVKTARDAFLHAGPDRCRP